MICVKCGKHTWYKADKCAYCGEKLHRIKCTKLPGDCECHLENLKGYNAAHHSEVEEKDATIRHKTKHSTTPSTG